MDQRTGKKGSIRKKITGLLFVMVFVTVILMGSAGIYSLYSMKRISVNSSTELGETAAEDAEEALEQMAAEHLQKLAVEKAAYIEEKFAAVESYVLGIAAQAAEIYDNPAAYPDRFIPLPVQGSRELAPQLLWSRKLVDKGSGNSMGEDHKGQVREQSVLPGLTPEILKLGNIQDLLVQYNANNDMVSSAYIATESGWMIQADYIAYSKYKDDSLQYYEADARQWYKWSKDAIPGQIVYTDVIRDVHEGGDCIVCATPVYVNNQLVAVAGAGSYLETVNNAVLNTSIGQAGYAFLVNGKGQVMVSPKAEGETAAHGEEPVDLRMSANEALAEAAERMVSGWTDSINLTLDGREVYLAYAPLNHLKWSFVTVMDVEEVVAPARDSQQRILELTGQVSDEQDTAIRRMILILVCVLAAAASLIGVGGSIFSAKLTNPIRSLTRDVAKLDGGNLDCRIEIVTGDEVEELGHAFNSMAGQLKDFIGNLASVTAEKERIRTEIQVASRLQADMLPDGDGALSQRKEFAIFAKMTPAKGVGGDFYDYFLLDDDHLALVCADVSGKGVPAALFMVVSRTLIRSKLGRTGMGAQWLAAAMDEVNESLCDNNKNDMFVTAWVGVLTISTGRLRYVNAGHCRPLIRRSNGNCSYETPVSGFVMAGMEGTAYKEFQLRLGPGDTLLLYTDGVTEATSAEKQLFGEDRLMDAVKETEGHHPKDIIEKLHRDVDVFQSGAEQFDDITMLALVYQGSGWKVKAGEPRMENMAAFSAFVEESLKEQGISRKTILKLKMATDEIFSNICYYSKAMEVMVGVNTGKPGSGIREAEISFMDNGMPFNPLEKPDPDVEELLEKRKEGGLGIYLVKKRMDDVTYENIDGKNCLIIVKRDIENHNQP